MTLFHKPLKRPFFEGGNDCSQLTDDEIRQIGTRFDSICEKIAIATSSVDGISIESDCHSNVAEKEEQLLSSMATSHEAVDKSSEQREIDKSYWENYYKFWDWFVQEWFKERAKDPNPIKYDDKYDYKELEEAFKRAVDGKKAEDCLKVDELPNPYFGDPKNGVDAVIINLNPGGSEKDKNLAGTDETQFYSNIDVGDDVSGGWLIRKFREEANCSYKRFVGNDENANVNWSQLNPKLRGHTPEVCGVKWWQGDNPKRVGGRMGWIRRIYGNTNLCPSKVFALELCPYHSKKFCLKKKNTDMLIQFIGKHVIEPMITAVVENKLPFAIAIGAEFKEIFDKAGSDLEKNGFKAEKFEEWSCVKDKSKLIINDKAREIIDKWPPLDKELKKERNYKLYRVSAGNYTAVILVTWARGGNSAPADDFSDVESVIRDYVNDYVKNEHLR